LRLQWGAGQLKQGDIILSINGKRLEGARAAFVMEEMQLEQYTLTVARPEEFILAGGKQVMPEGDMSGWITIGEAGPRIQSRICSEMLCMQSSAQHTR
jgi:hypothetical protein